MEILASILVSFEWIGARVHFPFAVVSMADGLVQAGMTSGSPHVSNASLIEKCSCYLPSIKSSLLFLAMTIDPSIGSHSLRVPQIMRVMRSDPHPGCAQR
jgi:hypothetical protein